MWDQTWAVKGQKEQNKKHKYLSFNIKGAACSFGEGIQMQNFNIYNINEVIIWTQKYLYSLYLNKQEIRSPEHCMKIERWQGPPHVNKIKQ